MVQRAKAQTSDSSAFASKPNHEQEQERSQREELVSSVVRNLIPAPQMQHLLEPASTRAINLFFLTYADGMYLEYLPGLYLSRNRPTSIGASFEAVALAHLANDQRRVDLQQLSQARYGHALALTTAALQSPQTMTTPETIASVLLLALYAAIAMDSTKEATQVWSSHVRGATAILAKCSPEIFCNSAGQGLLHHIISVVQLNCMHQRLPAPPELQTLYSASWLNHGPQAFFWSVFERIADINADIDKSGITLRHLEYLNNLDEDVHYLLLTMPRTYRGIFEYHEDVEMIQQTFTDNEGIFSIPNHIFRSHRVAQAWNSLRMMRLVVNTRLVSRIVVYSTISPLTSESQEILHTWLIKATEKSKQTAIEVCASVPTVLRPGQWRDGPSARHKFSAWARSTIFPLSLAEQSPHDSETLGGYIKQQLQILSSIAGLRSVSQEMTHGNVNSNFGDW